MKKAFSWKNLEYPVILCPPMDGVTDMAYRELVAEQGGSSAQYCEFVNVQGINHGNPKTFFELQYTDNQRPIIAQLFGSNPDYFYEAAKRTVKLDFDALDVNMGCPAHKVAAKGGGCSLMGDIDTARKIVENTVKGANESWQEMGNEGEYEVTCKMRLGINDTETVFTHGMAMIEAGAKCIAIHGRTLKQMYTGEADWEPIKRFKEQLIKDTRFSPQDRPRVFGSGDAKSLWEAFIRLATTGVDGVMIGRGSFGNPWVFDKERVAFMRQELLKLGWPNQIPDITKIPNIEHIKSVLENYTPSLDELKDMAIKHAEMMVADKGEKGITQMRKHLGWYFGGFEGAKHLRLQLVQVNSVDDIKRILDR
jgi:tRNA-dihydrouridine synthase B